MALHRGRPREDRWLRTVFDYLKEPTRATSVPEIADALRQRTTESVSVPRVRSGLRRLERLGRVKNGVVIQPDLLPAYLFLDVPTSSRERVDRFVAGLQPELLLPVRAVQFNCNLMIGLRVFDLDGLDRLCEEARRNGADRASGVVQRAGGVQRASARRPRPGSPRRAA